MELFGTGCSKGKRIGMLSTGKPIWAETSGSSTAVPIYSEISFSKSFCGLVNITDGILTGPVEVGIVSEAESSP